MANNIGSLGVVLTANIEQFKQGLKQAESHSKSFANNLKGSFGEAGNAVKGFVLAWASIEGVKKVMESFNGAGELQDMADGLGMSAQKLQQLEYAGIGAGVEIDRFRGLLQRVADVSSDAAAGNDELQATFAKLGMASVDLQNPDKTLLEIVKHLGEIPNVADRMAVAIQLGGKSGAQALMKLANEGVDALTKSMDEAKANGYAMSDALIKSADDIGDEIAKMSAVFKKDLMVAIVDNREEILTMAKAFFEVMPQMIGAASTLANWFVKLGEGIGVATAKLMGYESGEDNLVRVTGERNKLMQEQARIYQRLNELKGEGTKWYEVMDRSEKKQLETRLLGTQLMIDKKNKEISDLATFANKEVEIETKTTAAVTKEQAKRVAIKGSPSNKKAELTEEEKFLKSIDDLRAKTDAARLASLQKQTAELEKQMALFQMQDTSKMSTQQLEEYQQKMAEYKDAIKEVKDAQDAIYEEQLKGIREATKAQQDYNEEQRQSAKDILDTLDPLRKQQEELTKVQVLIDQGFLPPETLGRFKEFQEKTKETTDWAKEMGMTFQSAFQDAIINGEDFRSVLGGILKDMASMVLKLGVINPLMEAAFGTKASGSSAGTDGFMSGIISGVGGWFKDVLGFANGGIVGDGIPRFANGGVVGMSPSGAFIAGEAGPEAILPLKRSGGKLGVTATGMGGTTVINNYVTVNESQTPQMTAEAVQAQMTQIAQQQIVKATRIGGTLNPMAIS